ncbi:hypothetical protein JTB14_029284 [Gonioctena quinquepunctata]|nr:hypothetical protein JTB14_029284 [Gonioctena quinquepunctata]
MNRGFPQSYRPVSPTNIMCEYPDQPNMVRDLLALVLLFYLMEKSDGIIYGNPKNYAISPKYPDSGYTINKVVLTQRGYIQFLKYITEVPPLTDYTFCIWLRSHNLTHSHPILSYSKHEEERLIRVWIGPHGKNIHLEILNQPVFEVPINIEENHWNHICQSWSSQQAAWHLYFNGKLKSSGYMPKLRGSVIKGEGDIVVGQEYTDFDKGLNDGIEGDIFGFNFVLASSSVPLKHTTNFISRKQYDLPRRYHPYREKPHTVPLPLYPPISPPPPDPVLSTNSIQRGASSASQGLAFNQGSDTNQISSSIKVSPDTIDDVPDVLSYFKVHGNRDPKGLLDMFQNAFSFFEAEPSTKIKVVQVYKPKRQTSYNPLQRSGPSRVLNDIHEVRQPLGLLLVELSFNCGYRKGAPLDGKGVLINWTKSPVRVFGGAILKSVPPFCT